MVVGQPIDRVDGKLKVTGRAKYAADFEVPGLVHAVLIQSTIAAGEIEAFDVEEARKMPGVVAIITPDNAPRLAGKKLSPKAVMAPLLQDRDVAYNGQHVAIAVADTIERASAAAAAVRPRYREREAVTTMESALHQARPSGEHKDKSRGDPDATLARAPVRVEATYTTPIEHHNPMEPHATIAKWDGDRLTVWTATQGIGDARDTLAGLFGLDPENITVIGPFVGGGFGCKGNTWPPATLAAMAARLVRRPVKLAVTRAQMFTSNGYRPKTTQKIRLGADTEGRLLALRHEGFSQTSMPSLGEFAEAVGAATDMLYACPNVAVAHRVVSVNAGLPTYMRAPGWSSGVFATESAMDELAAALKLDPVELRLRNYTDTDPSNGKPFASKALRECYRRGAAAFAWEKRHPEPRSTRDGRVLVGIGMASSVYPTHRFAAQASVRLNADGTALVRSGSQDLGTGTYTVMSQVAADELGLPIGRVRVELGDSRFPPAPESGGSCTVASVAPAVQEAAEAVRAQLLQLAAAELRGDGRDIDLGQLSFRNGAVSGPHGRVSIGELLARNGTEHLEAVGKAKPSEQAEAHSRYAFGAQFAEVHVDPDLGTIRVSRYCGAFDCGRLLNAKTARSQIIGGIVFGIGMALLEETRVDAENGRVVNANISEYLVPVNADVPKIETLIVASTDPVSTRLGVKGLGELAMVGVAPAIANAVWHATGIRARKLPIRIEDVLG